MHPEIEEAKKSLEHSQQKIRDVIQRVQDNCKHPIESCFQSKSTRETYTIGCGYGSSSVGTPPFNVCSICGYSECSWYAPHPRKLDNYNLPIISYDKAMGLMVGGIRTKE